MTTETSPEYALGVQHEREGRALDEPEIDALLGTFTASVQMADYFRARQDVQRSGLN